jgi:hypothetical protein
MSAWRTISVFTTAIAAIVGCSAPTQSRDVVCAMPGIATIVAQIRNDRGQPNAIGSTVQIRNTQGYLAASKGYGDSLRVSVGDDGKNVGGTFTVEVTKPYHQAAVVARVVVPEGPCGIEASKIVAVTLTRLPGAPPVRQVVTIPHNYSLGYGNWSATLKAYVEADSGVSQTLAWRSSDTTVFALSVDGVLRTACRTLNGDAWAIARSVVDTTIRDSVHVFVNADTNPVRCPRP